VFRRSEFRALWAADVLSVLGDQLTRVALAVLVFARTDSAAWAAGTYALTFLPAIVGGVALAGAADRFRRREVLVACDLLRAGPVALMAVPGLPLPLMCGLVVVVVLLGAPYAAARGALLPAVLPGDLYERGLAVIQMSAQTSQLAGFAAGGVLVAALGPGPALLLDAATFLLAGAIVRIGLVDRPAAGRPGAARSHWRDAVAGIVDIAADPRRRSLIALAWTIGCFVVPEALAVPYAAQVGAGTATVGLLMAAGPLGSILGAWLFVRFVPPERRPALIGPAAVAAGVPLLLTALRPGLPVIILLWAVSGLLSTAYLLQAQASFVRATPEAIRGRAIGVASSGVIASQGVAVLGGGLLADALDPATAIVVGGGAGTALALVGAVAWRRARGEGRGQRGAVVATTTAADPRPRPDG
jgi:MFS family permease